MEKYQADSEGKLSLKTSLFLGNSERSMKEQGELRYLYVSNEQLFDGEML